MVDLGDMGEKNIEWHHLLTSPSVPNITNVPECLSQSYQTFIFPVFRFSLLSLRVCSIWKNACNVQQPSLVAKKRKNYSFTKKKSLVGSTPKRTFTQNNNQKKILRLLEQAIVLSLWFFHFVEWEIDFQKGSSINDVMLLGGSSKSGHATKF